MFGGIRGISWRTLYHQKIFGLNKISSVKDVRLLLNITDHLIHNPRDQQDSFFHIINGIVDSTG